MAGLIKKALLSLVMDKKARRKLERRSEIEEAKKKGKPPSPKRPLTPERQELIQEAKKIMRTKKDVLGNLSPEAKAKLIAMAFAAAPQDEDDKA